MFVKHWRRLLGATASRLIGSVSAVKKDQTMVAQSSKGVVGLQHLGENIGLVHSPRCSVLPRSAKALVT